MTRYEAWQSYIEDALPFMVEQSTVARQTAFDHGYDAALARIDDMLAANDWDAVTFMGHVLELLEAELGGR